MFRRRAQHHATDELIEIGPPLTPGLDDRLADAVARGHKLAEAGRSVRSQHEYERWKDDLARWRTEIAMILEAGFATAVARDAMREMWLSNTPLARSGPIG